MADNVVTPIEGTFPGAPGVGAGFSAASSPDETKSKRQKKHKQLQDLIFFAQRSPDAFEKLLEAAFGEAENNLSEFNVPSDFLNKNGAPKKSIKNLLREHCRSKREIFNEISDDTTRSFSKGRNRAKIKGAVKTSQQVQEFISNAAIALLPEQQPMRTRDEQAKWQNAPAAEAA